MASNLNLPLRAAAVVVAALPLLAWGCGSGSGTTASTTRAASGSCPSSVYRCVLVSFTNELPEPVVVSADGMDLGKATLELAPGAWGVIRGWSSGPLAKNDIEGSIYRADEPTYRAYFEVMNPSVGRPCMSVVATARDLQTNSCPGASQPGSSSHRGMTSDIIWATVAFQRELDTTHFVQFVARIRPPA